MDNIDIKKHHWISPVFVIQSVLKMYELYSEDAVTTRGEFKSVREAMAVAIMLLGMYDNQKIHYFMQVSRDTFPDVLTLTLVEKAVSPYVEGQYQTVEVVTYEEHATAPDVFSFLRDTKLSFKKSYDRMTIILCLVNKETQIPDEATLHNQLRALSPRPQIVLLGKLRGERQYNLMQVWPFAKRHVFDASVVAPQYPLPPHMKLDRTLDKKVKFTHTKEVKAPTLYEVFGIDEKKVEKYLKH